MILTLSVAIGFQDTILMGNAYGKPNSVLNISFVIFDAPFDYIIYFFSLKRTFNFNIKQSYNFHLVFFPTISIMLPTKAT